MARFALSRAGLFRLNGDGNWSREITRKELRRLCQTGYDFDYGGVIDRWDRVARNARLDSRPEMVDLMMNDWDFDPDYVHAFVFAQRGPTAEEKRCFDREEFEKLSLILGCTQRTLRQVAHAKRFDLSGNDYNVFADFLDEVVKDPKMAALARRTAAYYDVRCSTAKD
jgi:hypothetical protein